MFALMNEYSYSEMPEFCNSRCVYVKMSELKPLVEQWNNVTADMNMTRKAGKEEKDDSSMMEEMLGYEKWTMMKLTMMVQRLQKYCFMDSDEGQAMCAEPDVDVLHMMMSGKLLRAKYF